jgi:hypothetical protein
MADEPLPTLRIKTQDEYLCIFIASAAITDSADYGLVPYIMINPDDAMRLALRLSEWAVEHGTDID